MADYDPNIGVPAWVNIVVPIICAAAFAVVVVLLYRTKRECDVEYLEDLVEKIPILGDWMLEECEENKRYLDKRKQPRSTAVSQSNNGFNVDIYDSLSKARTYGTCGTSASDVTSVASSARKPYLYTSQGTLVSFESNV